MKKILITLLGILGGLLVVCFWLGIIIAFPLGILFSLNTLFPALNIPYNLQTWVSAFLLWAFFGRTFNQLPDKKAKEEDKPCINAEDLLK